MPRMRTRASLKSPLVSSSPSPRARTMMLPAVHLRARMSGTPASCTWAQTTGKKPRRLCPLSAPPCTALACAGRARGSGRALAASMGTRAFIAMPARRASRRPEGRRRSAPCARARARHSSEPRRTRRFSIWSRARSQSPARPSSRRFPEALLRLSRRCRPRPGSHRRLGCLHRGPGLWYRRRLSRGARRRWACHSRQRQA
mmetsp:Transcript_1648/g.5075  ORF Transcript_1648/g.5075 Transcript_1648/m.5075 type:complete len:201 (+) Transcript_1648:293-895(+)